MQKHKHALRKSLRQRRRNLTQRQQHNASMGLCRQLSKLPVFVYSERIAAYLPNDGEIDPQPLLELAWRMGKRVYLPILQPAKTGKLLFMRHWADQPLAKNRYGIPEPLCQEDGRCKTWTIDLVLTPLVGFDEKGNRMGMGGGFYDRTFDFMNNSTRPRKPTMIGVAHECQKVDSLPNERWDIPMDMIVTGSRSYITPLQGIRSVNKC